MRSDASGSNDDSLSVFEKKRGGMYPFVTGPMSEARIRAGEDRGRIARPALRWGAGQACRTCGILVAWRRT